MSAARWTPNDPLFPKQWNMELIRAPEAWAIERGSPEVMVAIIELSFEMDHPDVRDKWVHPTIWESAVHTPMFAAHGTHVAGIIGAETDNGVGVAGVAPECRLMPIACLCADELVLAKAIRHATDHGARIINMSMAGVDYDFVHPRDPSIPFRRGRCGITTTDELMSAVEYAEGKSVLLCKALGGNVQCNMVGYPSPNGHVLNVGATDRKGRRTDVAAYGDYLDLLAPSGWRGGVDPATNLPQDPLPKDAPAEAHFRESGPPYGVLSAGHSQGSDYHEQSGTCQAVAHVSGVAALVFSRHPEWSPSQVREVLLNTADGSGWAPYFGHGLLNAYDAVKVDRFESEVEIVGATVERKSSFHEVTVRIANRGVRGAKGIVVLLFTDMPNEGHGVQLGYRVLDVRGFEEAEARIPILHSEDAEHPVVVVDLQRNRSTQQTNDGTRHLSRRVN